MPRDNRLFFRFTVGSMIRYGRRPVDARSPTLGVTDPVFPTCRRTFFIRASRTDSWLRQLVRDRMKQ